MLKTLVIALAVITGYSYMTNKKTKYGVFKLSDQGLQFIKLREGWSSVIYYDEAGLPTIGYGHLIKAGERYTKITLEEGEKILKQDVQLFELAVDQLVDIDLTQGQFDALTSFAYNIGIQAFKGSTMLNLINAGDTQAAANEFKKWDKVTKNGVKVASAGLANRREAERQLYLA